jgi:iron complex transport system substrate-binding protein
LLPSATEIVSALGLLSHQVGRSHECDYPPEISALPVCSRPNIEINGSSADIDRLVKTRLAAAASIYDLDIQLIRELHPTHILTQTLCQVCAVSLEQVERAIQNEIGSDARIISLEPNRLEDLWRDVRKIAAAFEQDDAAADLIRSWRARMQGVALRAQAAHSRPTIAAIEWLEPLMAAGNWIPELIQMASGSDLFGAPGEHSPWISWDDLVSADPDIIIALPCGFNRARTRSEMGWLTQRPRWQELRAVRAGRIFLCDGNQFMSRPGPRLVESLQIFAEIFHPEQFTPALEGNGWERY